MLPPGLTFVAAGRQAREVARAGGEPRGYGRTRGRDGTGSCGRFHGFPPARMVFGLREALDMLEERLPAVFAPHARLAAAVRAAVDRWAEAGALGFHCPEPAARADTATVLAFAPEIEPDRIRGRRPERCGVAFGGGVGPFRGWPLRIAHPGDLDEGMILGALGVLELVLREAAVPRGRGGIEAAIGALSRG